MHAAAKPQVLGLLLVLLGCALRLRTGVDITTLVLVGLFQLATAPVAAHMVGRAAHRDRRLRPDLLVIDELSAHADRIDQQHGVRKNPDRPAREASPRRFPWWNGQRRRRE